METLVGTEPLALNKDGKRIPSEKHVGNLESARTLGPETIRSSFHPIGTCAMMPKALGGVVNKRLIVHETRNLRVWMLV